MKERATEPSRTIAQIAAADNVSPRTVRRWIERGELVAFRIGRIVRVTVEEHERFRKWHSR